MKAIGKRHGTDKVDSHRYDEFYEPILTGMRHTATRVLEFGVFEGASVLMWRDYFPNAEVHGVDNVEREGTKNFYNAMERNAVDRIVLHRCDQGSDENLTELRSKFESETFDFIIDDGSHFNRDQQRTFEIFFPLLKPGGVYCIEDLHCSVDPEREERNGRPKWRKRTTLAAVKQLEQDGTWEAVNGDDLEVDISQFTEKAKVHGPPHHITCSIHRLKICA